MVAERHRRRERHHHRRRAGTLSGQRPLHAGFPVRLRAPWAACWCRPPDGKRQIPLAQLASIKAASGPAMIRNEDGLLTGYVYVDIAGRDPDGYVEEAGPAAPGQGETAAGLRHLLERPVRGDAAGEGAADCWSCR